MTTQGNNTVSVRFRLPEKLRDELKAKVKPGGTVREVFGYRTMTQAVESELRKMIERADDAADNGRRLDSFR